MSIHPLILTTKYQEKKTTTGEENSGKGKKQGCEKRRTIQGMGRSETGDEVEAPITQVNPWETKLQHK